MPQSSLVEVPAAPAASSPPPCAEPPAVCAPLAPAEVFAEPPAPALCTPPAPAGLAPALLAVPPPLVVPPSLEELEHAQHRPRVANPRKIQLLAQAQRARLMVCERTTRTHSHRNADRVARWARRTATLSFWALGARSDRSCDSSTSECGVVNEHRPLLAHGRVGAESVPCRVVAACVIRCSKMQLAIFPSRRSMRVAGNVFCVPRGPMNSALRTIFFN